MVLTAKMQRRELSGTQKADTYAKASSKSSFREQKQWWDRRLACRFNNGQDARPTQESATRLTGYCIGPRQILSSAINS